MRSLLTVALAAGIMAAAGAAQWADEDRLTVQRSEDFGAFVADANGRALYMFTEDRKATGKKAAVSDCYEACAEAWPPLVVEKAPQVSEGLRKGLVGTFKRRDGRMQVTYGGWPLYYFVEDRLADKESGQTGQNVFTHGGLWHLVSPDGSVNARKDETEKGSVRDPADPS